MQTPRDIGLLFFLLLLGTAAFLYYPKQQAELTNKNELAELISASSSSVLELTLDSRLKSANCEKAGALPDHACTPGAVFPDANISQICVSGYTKTVRSVPLKLRKQIFAEYGVPYPQPTGSTEVDHLIPLAIGGSNDISNLWVEPAAPIPGFKEKDVVEIYLQQEMCAGRADLRTAQVRIASDWLSIYNKLSPEEISQIKAKYQNWSN